MCNAWKMSATCTFYYSHTQNLSYQALYCKMCTWGVHWGTTLHCRFDNTKNGCHTVAIIQDGCMTLMKVLAQECTKIHQFDMYMAIILLHQDHFKSRSCKQSSFVALHIFDSDEIGTY